MSSRSPVICRSSGNGRKRDGDTFAFGERARALNALFHHLFDRDRLTLQFHLSSGKALDIEEDLYHARQALRFRVDEQRDLLSLLFSERKAGHQLARTLNGGKRRAHFVSDEVHGLLIALPRGKFRAPVAAHYQVVIGSGAQETQRTNHRRRGEAEHPAVREEDVGRDAADGDDNNTSSVGPPTRQAAERQADRSGKREAKEPHPVAVNIDDEQTIGHGFERLGIDFDAGGYLAADWSCQTVSYLSSGSDADEYGFAGKRISERRIGEKLRHRDAWDGRHAREHEADTHQPAIIGRFPLDGVDVPRRDRDHLRTHLQGLRRFDNLAHARIKAEGFE